MRIGARLARAADGAARAIAMGEEAAAHYGYRYSVWLCWVNGCRGWVSGWLGDWRNMPLGERLMEGLKMRKRKARPGLALVVGIVSGLLGIGVAIAVMVTHTWQAWPIAVTAVLLSALGVPANWRAWRAARAKPAAAGWSAYLEDGEATHVMLNANTKVFKEGPSGWESMK